ncbi:MerR family transcriptional regulator [Clostridium felsineum]|uniref:MerR family transcriptional regulator n=1 Tax=Clostridium felsineum TaxID=36839 RepID=UPI00098C533B|nr:MerR family transcriptional regulator [Clostridium felsineum]URZ16578.1 Multidrug-efflux transporter 1 regulator [Clostridium felsineum DSM 794]
MENYLSISQMAKIHNLSRQTLIYYDKIDLFKPIYIDKNAYRYYSVYQIPFLREICFLKSIGVKLEDIKKHIKNRDTRSAISLLKCHEKFIDEEIEKLNKVRASIEERLNLYSSVEEFKDELYRPMVEEFGERRVIFIPFEKEISREELHLTQVKIRKIINKHNILPASEFGVIIKKDKIDKEYIFEDAGGFIVLPDVEYPIENTIVLPKGKYACMYKYGMPYNTTDLENLIKWINNNNYKIVGDIIDACILDATFYSSRSKTDLCQLQIPVEI